MRAVVYDRYGAPDVLRLAEVERPVPKEDEVLIKIHATTVNRSDGATREANRRGGLALTFISRLVSGLRRPRQRILGNELAGEVEEVGAAVTEFVVGDHVFGTSGFRFGAHAEFTCLPESARIAHKPAGMSFRGGCGGLRRSTQCTVVPERGTPAEGAEDPHLRSIWIHRHRGDTVGQVLRSRRHGGVQHQERRDRESARSRHGHRLHA